MTNMLNLSEAANLAVHALSVMAAGNSREPMSAANLAETLGASESHLSKVLQGLARKGMIRSTRGARGGFIFDDDSSLTLLDVITAVDGPFPDSGCLLGRPICSKGSCRLQSLMKKVTKIVREELASIPLVDFVRGPIKTPASLNR